MATYHVRAQVDAEDGDCAQRQRNVCNNKYQEGGDLWNVTGQGVGDGFLQVIEDQATCESEVFLPHGRKRQTTQCARPTAVQGWLLKGSTRTS